MRSLIDVSRLLLGSTVVLLCAGCGGSDSDPDAGPASAEVAVMGADLAPSAAADVAADLAELAPPDVDAAGALPADLLAPA